MKGAIGKNPVVSNILQAVTITVVGFLLLDLTFILTAVYQGLLRLLFSLFVPVETLMSGFWYPLLARLSFLVVIGLVSWWILRSKAAAVYKATFSLVPIATVYVTIGMFLSRWPVAVYTLGAAFGVGVGYYLYRTKQKWQYYYALALISAVLLYMMISGIDI